MDSSERSELKMGDDQPEMLSLPGILISTTKDKEKAAELEIIKQLEKIADELYPESSERKEGIVEEDLDFEEMLKRDLESMKDASVKSQRFSRWPHNYVYCPPIFLLTLISRTMQQGGFLL